MIIPEARLFSALMTPSNQCLQPLLIDLPPFSWTQLVGPTLDRLEGVGAGKGALKTPQTCSTTIKNQGLDSFSAGHSKTQRNSMSQGMNVKKSQTWFLTASHGESAKTECSLEAAWPAPELVLGLPAKTH